MELRSSVFLNSAAISVCASHPACPPPFYTRPGSQIPGRRVRSFLSATFTYVGIQEVELERAGEKSAVGGSDPFVPIFKHMHSIKGVTPNKNDLGCFITTSQLPQQVTSQCTFIILKTGVVYTTA